MAKTANKNLIIISQDEVQRKGGIVILPLRKYQELCERAVPTYRLKGKEAEKLDRLVKKGLKDYALGKTRRIKSLKDLE